jgi:trimethylamine--corrinoid protein Co-methyltransferase
MQPQINFVSHDELQRLHEAALWLLNNVGMQVFSTEAVKIMRNGGARIEKENIVKIPADLVTYALEKVPKREGFILYGRDQRHDIHFGIDTPALSSMMEATHVIDLETGQRRLCTNKDLADMVRLMDALENIVVNGPLVTPQDVPKETADLYAVATTLKNTSKHVVSPSHGARFVKDVVAMASLAVGSEENFRQRPFVSFGVLSQCPFQIDRLSVEGLLEISRQGLPVAVSSGPIMGTTSPVTIAGTVAQAHAEILAILTLSQLVRPSTSIIYTSFARSMDMKTGNVSMASPEFGILRGTMGQLGRYLGLPVKMPAFLRDAKILDGQAGFETGTVGLISTLASDLINSMQYDMDTLVDFADLVFSDEAMAALKRIAKGFSIDENALALDVIKQAGHGGNFLGCEHTLRNHRKEMWVPRLMERRSWAQWEKEGGRDIKRRAREKAREILASREPVRLSQEAEAEIDRITREATMNSAK